MASQTADETRGRRFASQLFTKAMKRSGKGMPDDAAANRAEFIIDPNRNVETIGPQEHSARNEHNVTENREEA